ncbi:mitochondrial amidoxime-reducing component 1-like [Lutzomyia longipalpis]|uniref:mitochondrial amidoxime-reducing component 1-like n=1 Tax=Lutzomyia longipalpis TaxID=7200 RepID=UPI002483FC46|nr:mitochondrial amidoxime-reducing component 1-like [Lutzomyia longipalpis]
MLDLFSSVHARVSVSVALGLGVVAATFGYFYRKKLLTEPPKKWIRVGDLTSLMIYPIKSCAGIPASELQCNILGLGEGYLRDRVFMLVTVEGQFITARSHPKCVQIQPRIIFSKMYLIAPDQPEMFVDTELLKKKARVIASVWGEEVSTIDCGDAVAKWLSKYLLDRDTGVRLVYYPDTFPTRNAWSIRKNNKDLETHAGALHDITSFMLMNQASVDDLNKRLQEPVSVAQLRPNFLVSGRKEYEEDEWNWVKIGNVIFKNVKLCGRCIFTNINPDTGERNPAGEPLKTLKSYRMVSEDIDAPIMGIHLGVHTSGSVNLGDPVYVGVTPSSSS